MQAHKFQGSTEAGNTVSKCPKEVAKCPSRLIIEPVAIMHIREIYSAFLSSTVRVPELAKAGGNRCLGRSACTPGSPPLQCKVVGSSLVRFRRIN